MKLSLLAHFYLVVVISNLTGDLEGFENDPFNRIVGISYSECFAQCDRSNLCACSTFLMRFHFCKLYQQCAGNSSVEQEPGIKVYKKTNFTQKCDINNADPKCNTGTCPVPKPVLDTEIIGNMIKIGSRVKHKCINAGKSWISTCLANGSWTEGNCYNGNCKPPNNIQNGYVTSSYRVNNTHFVANVMCDEGYSLRQNAELTCDDRTEMWTVENVCCDKIIDGDWQMIYSYPKETDLNLIYNLYDLHGNMDREIGSYCFYRNTTVFDNWATMNISRVRFDIKVGSEVVAFMLFNGTASRHLEWFNQSRLLNSSWYDLNASTPLDYFSFLGYSSSLTLQLRYFINKRFSGPGNCFDDLGWFVVSWTYYPCDLSKEGKRILYAKNNNVSKFTVDEIGFADRYEIWIKKDP